MTAPVEQFLRSRGAAGIAHPGGTLEYADPVEITRLDHLVLTVRDITATLVFRRPRPDTGGLRRRPAGPDVRQTSIRPATSGNPTPGRRPPGRPTCA